VLRILINTILWGHREGRKELRKQLSSIQPCILAAITVIALRTEPSLAEASRQGVRYQRVVCYDLNVVRPRLFMTSIPYRPADPQRVQGPRMQLLAGSKWLRGRFNFRKNRPSKFDTSVVAKMNFALGGRWRRTWKARVCAARRLEVSLSSQPNSMASPWTVWHLCAFQRPIPTVSLGPDVVIGERGARVRARRGI